VVCTDVFGLTVNRSLRKSTADIFLILIVPQLSNKELGGVEKDIAGDMAIMSCSNTFF